MVIDDRFYSLCEKDTLCSDCVWRNSCISIAHDECEGFFPWLDHSRNPSYWQEMSYRKEDAMSGITIGERMRRERKAE